MPLTFYPHSDDTQKGSFEDRIEVMMEAAERYKAFVLDAASKPAPATVENNNQDRGLRPIDLVVVYNWEEIAVLLREIRELPEGAVADKQKKAALLKTLAEVYEVLRDAKMPKLEAVRVSLISEATQLSGGAASP